MCPCATRLYNIAGKYTGKDDPIALVRVQGTFPATSEVLSPFAIGHFVAGHMRGSHTGPLMSVRANSSVSFFDSTSIVSTQAFCVHEGRLVGPADAFDQPQWDYVRKRVEQKLLDIFAQSFSGSAMLECSEPEYGGIVELVKKQVSQFKRTSSRPPWKRCQGKKLFVTAMR